MPLIIPGLPGHRMAKKRGSNRVSWAYLHFDVEVAVRLRQSTAALECYFGAGGLLKLFV